MLYEIVFDDKKHCGWTERKTSDTRLRLFWPGKTLEESVGQIMAYVDERYPQKETYFRFVPAARPEEV